MGKLEILIVFLIGFIFCTSLYILGTQYKEKAPVLTIKEKILIHSIVEAFQTELVCEDGSGPTLREK